MGDVDQDRRRTVVTGMGIVSPLGPLESFWHAIAGADGRPVGARYPTFDGAAWLGKADLLRTDSRMQYAVAAAAQALAHAGFPAAVPDGPGPPADALPIGGSDLRVGVIIGNTHGAAGRVELETQALEEGGRKAVAPFLAVLANDNMPASLIAQRFGFRGPCKMVGGACASGTYAVADGEALIRSGQCDVVVAGATAGFLPDVLLAAYENLRVISPSGVVRPFDRRREGFVYTGGAAVLVLEERERAVARGARVLGEVLGSAATNDAFHPIRQNGVGAADCMRLALEDAGLEPGEIHHVNAHGSATEMNDRVEAAAIHEVFGARTPSVTSIKGVTGHSLGAAGAFEVVSVLLSFAHAALPPVGIDVELDPGIELDVVVGGPRPWSPGPTLSNSFGLGGENGSVVLGPPDVAARAPSGPGA